MLHADLSELDLVALMIDGVHFADHLCVVALGIGDRRHQDPSRPGRGSTREHHRRRRCSPTCATGVWTRPGRSCASSTGPRRSPRRCVSLRPPGHPTLPAPQDPQRRAPSPRRAGLDRRQEDARRLPRPRPAGRRGDPRGPRPPARQGHPGAAGSCAKDWPRRSPSPAWACPPPWPARCGPRTRSSR